MTTGKGNFKEKIIRTLFALLLSAVAVSIQSHGAVAFWSNS